MILYPLTISPYDFYPRPPRGGRLNRVITSGQHSQFLSTPSARRATNMTVYLTELILDFYPRPPRGGRLAVVGSKVCSLPISIHALREEGDEEEIKAVLEGKAFLSTPSARRATTLPTVSQTVIITRFLSTPSARRATCL